MLKQFFNGHQDAWHYAKVMGVLKRDFGLNHSHVEQNPAELDALGHCGRLRREGRNVETTTLIILTTLLDMKVNFPDVFQDLPVYPTQWRDKTSEWMAKSLVPDAVFLFFEHWLSKHEEKLLEDCPLRKAFREERAQKEAAAQLREKIRAQIQLENLEYERRRNESKT